MKNFSDIMKTVFIGAVAKREPDYGKAKEEINFLPYKKIAICYSNQFVHVAKKISEIIDKEITGMIQVLGCSNPKFKEGTEAILIIGQGKFHSVSLAYESKLPTYILEDSSLSQIEEKDIERMEKKEKAALMRYLTNDKIGILITSKPGQMRLKKALDFKKKLTEKKAYLFIDNHIDINQFENFGIKCWVNTSCPRMDLTDGPLINLDKIPEELIK